MLLYVLHKFSCISRHIDELEHGENATLPVQNFLGEFLENKVISLVIDQLMIFLVSRPSLVSSVYRKLKQQIQSEGSSN